MNMDKLGRLDKYKANLLYIDGDKVFSYHTHVADIDHSKKVVRKLGYYSPTTSKHINYVAKLLNYKTEISQ